MIKSQIICELRPIREGGNVSGYRVIKLKKFPKNKQDRKN